MARKSSSGLVHEVRPDGTVLVEGPGGEIKQGRLRMRPDGTLRVVRPEKPDDGTDQDGPSTPYRPRIDQDE